MIFNTRANECVFKEGYYLVASSWENDGDNRRTEVMFFETKEEAFLYASCVEKYASVYGNECEEYPNHEDFNIDNFTQEEIAYILQEEHAPAEIDIDTLKDYLSEMAYEILGAPNEYYICRVLDSYSVFKNANEFPMLKVNP